MKACGLIAEYNPFHKGHEYHLNKARSLTKADVMIVVMSPNFVQRGEPSVFDKGTRVKTALQAGVNLVVELPFVYAVEAADIFAKYALLTLEALDCRYVVFGSETGTVAELEEKYRGDYVSTPRLDEEIRRYLDKGMGYPKARALAQKNIHNYYLETPNDILATSYLNTIKSQKLTIEPLSFKRIKKYKNAQKIRKLIIKNKDIPELVQFKYNFNAAKKLDDYFELLKYRLTTSSPEEIRRIHLVDEGIENLFIKNIRAATSMDDFIESCVSKRYSGARIKRTIIHILTNTPKEEASAILQRPIPYIRILGFDTKGQEYLASIRKKVKTPIFAKFPGKNYPVAQLEKRASDVYYALEKEPLRAKKQEREIAAFPIIFSSKK